MTIQEKSNVFSLATATGATFPELDKTGFTAEFRDLFFSDAPEYIGGNAYKEIAQPLGRAVIRTDTKEPLGIVGKSYGIAQNNDLRDQVIESAERALPREYLRNIELTETVSGGGAFTKFEFTFPNAAAGIRQKLDKRGGYNSDTILNFKLSIVNSFGGRTPVIAKAGVVDLVCLNGMVASIYDTSKKRHTSGLDVTQFAGFIDEQARDYMARVRIWQQWADRHITAIDAEALLTEAGLSERLTKKFMQQIEKEFAARGNNLWAVASAATFYSSHNSELFPVRNAASADNIAETLNKRENDMTRLFNSRAWAFAASGQAA